MPRYADSLLSQGERVVLRSRQHWLATVIDGRYPWLILVASLVVLLLSQGIDGPPREIVGYLVLAGVVVALAWLTRIYLAWWSQDYLVTTRRVLKVDGIINKRSADSSLEKINDALLHQNLAGRLLNYGDLDILTASTAAIDDFRMLRGAAHFKRVMLDQKHAIESEVPRMPGPPLRATAPGGNGGSAGNGRAVPATEAAVPMAAHQPGAPAHPPSAPHPNVLPMTADEVARALGTLAELRERKAITAEEYEQRRADYLSRL